MIPLGRRPHSVFNYNRLAVWGRHKVTVCIAAFAEFEEQFVFVSDSRVAFGDFSTDKGGVKYELLGSKYLAMIAGNDIVYALPTIRRVRARIFRKPTLDPDEVAAIVHEELCTTRDQVIEAKVLKRYKMDAEKFLKIGKKSFTDTVFYNICNRIDQEHLSLQFIVAGFDASGKPHLRVVSADEPPHDYDGIGYAAIGTGAASALASLSFAKDHCGFGRDTKMHEAAYHLIAAKFMAESATDVGRDTFFLSVGAKRVYHMFSIGGLSALRDAWEKDGAPRRSKRSIKVLEDIIYEHNEHFLSLPVLSRCFKYIAKKHKKVFKLMMQPDFQERLKSKSHREVLLTQLNSQKLEDQQ